MPSLATSTVTVMLQRFDERRGDLRLVLHDEDALRTPTRQAVVGSDRTHGGSGDHRKRNDERRAVPGLALDGQGAAVLLDDPAAQREAEARPLAGRRGGEERLEDLRLQLRRNARPRVG